MIELNSGRLAVAFDPACGAIRRITDLKTGILLAESQSEDAFLLECEQDCFTSAYESFSAVEDEGAVELIWKLQNGVIICAHVRVVGEEIAFTAQARSLKQERLHSLEYPLIDGIRRITGEEDFVAHAYATGFLVQNPSEAFEEEGDGFRYMPYPESFSGCSMQFFTYYAKNHCGLYFAAYDGEFYPKWLNFYKHKGALRASQIFGYEDIGPGRPLETKWDFVLRATEGDDWYEAADLYKAWALKQTWCKKGKLQTLPETEKAGWLLEETGAATFGINGRHDRTKWIRKYREAVGASLFHVTGPDWTRVPQTYGSGVPGGYDDWFPTCFCQENLETFKAIGDRFAPFEFDFLVDVDRADREKIAKSLQKWPDNPISCDSYAFHMLCPICGYTHELHVERDRRVVRESGADAMYYDISANNILKTCMDETHGHSVGGGKALTQAYRAIYRDTKTALRRDTGKYVPLGTEMINETLIDVLDYYQARANAQPCSALETWPFRALVKRNQAWVIPLFQYVYSGYGPVRLDGWGKLAAEGGNLIYHTIAKTYLWGGLFEINSEYSPMEIIDGDGENASSEHYCALEPRGFWFDEQIVAYLAKFAALRTGPHGRFLALGTMLRAPELECAKLERSYFQYNHSANAGEQNDRGQVLRDSVLAQAYTLDGETALFIANTTPFPQRTVWKHRAFDGAEMGRVCWDYTRENDKEEVVAVCRLQEVELKPYQLMVVRIGMEKNS